MLRKNNGMTLIELIITLGLTSILIAAMYRTVISQQKTYTVQEQVVDVQQNVRAAIGQMVREIRMAGYRRDILDAAGNINGFTQIITPVDKTNHVGKNDDQITIIIADKAITYRLQQDNTDPTKPVLVRDENTGVGGQVIAENIEDLQIRYTLSNGTETDSPGNPDQIKMVKITITGRTRIADPQSSGDGYQRRELSSIIKVRNFGG